MAQYELQQERMRYEEQQHVIEERVREGEMTQEEAHKIMARGRMHHKIEEEESGFRLDESAAAGADYATTQQIIEEVLDTEEKTYCIRWIKKVTGWAWLMKKAKVEKERRANPEYQHMFPA